ncbi:NAD(P)-binding domain-containing protein [Marinibactrum halimedae]|uniref:Pyridine nucleotide-disulfide oxidoreductase n=1 Tax=Marinibactrum halimedae TaxID=1444977 RepID=A0AA37T1N7_9GAMM|nr:NAD(P)-binding domain-containing protein [Marinibactrum halimedae]MCD9460855.1 NAD(P)-binding domain-containing protein [Marinibactrum halimedae]GLS24563.1 pyridine nucleotide-disulfide oxidoreductase [Marinibactrum halimedae]
MKLDYIVVGAGPAGLQLAYFLEKQQQSYTIVESAERVGEFFRHYPRHRKLISINKVNTGFDDAEMNLRWDWNSLLNDKVFFPEYSQDYFSSADKLTDYLEDFTTTHNLNIKFGFKVLNVSKSGGEFVLKSESGEVVQGKNLIVATGFSKEKVPTFPGAELAEMYSEHDIDPMKYKNKRVLILGKGNSALETAENLIETSATVALCSPNPIKLAWNTHYVGNVRAVNNNFLDTYQLKSQNIVLDADITSLERTDDGKIMAHIHYTHAKDELRSIPFDHVIMATGFKFDNTIFDESCRPALSHEGKFPKMTSSWESTNVSNMYFAGVLMHQRDFKRTMSGFIHGFRYNIRALSHILNKKNNGIAWPAEKLSADSAVIAKHVLRQLTYSSSMFLQPGFMGDVMVFDTPEDVIYMKDVPIEYMEDSELSSKESYCTISLEYGDFSHVTDPFNIERDPSPAKAHEVEYLHPIIRFYSKGKMSYERHILEDLENDYERECFREVTENIFKEALMEAAMTSDFVKPAMQKTVMPKVVIGTNAAMGKDIASPMEIAE